MKEENLKSKSDGNSPIEAIRHIIFGDQEKTLNYKFDEIYKNLDVLSQDLFAKISELQQQQDKDRKQFSQKISKIQTLIEENEKNSDQKLQQSQSELNSKKLNRAALADQLEKLAKFLRDNE